MQFPIQDQYIHTSRENKLQLNQNGACSHAVSGEIFCLTAVIVACSLCSYEYTDPDPDTLYCSVFGENAMHCPIQKS